jgi:membrane protein YdbS with pleckstrin-like domain
LKSTRPLQGFLVLWAIWEIINASLSTFAAQLGASFVGWMPKGGWTSDLYSMSQQYGMVLFLLAAVYLLIATDPVRYRAFVWIAIGEQLIGIAYGVYELAGNHTLTGPQFATQIAFNVVVAALFYLLRPSTNEARRDVRSANA